MNRRWRLLFVLLVTVLVIGWCSSRSASAGDKAKERSDQKSGEKRQQDQAGPRRSGDKSAHEQKQMRERDRIQEKRERSQRGAEQRHPRFLGPPVQNPGKDRHNRYHWNNYRDHAKPRANRFPRYYGNRDLFHNRHYRGHLFGPHYRFQYFFGGMYEFFYWPYFYEPLWGCGWYWVPYQRILVIDPDSGEQYWEYWDYRYRYICFD